MTTTSNHNRCPHTGHIIRKMSDAEKRMAEKEMRRADDARERTAAWMWETRNSNKM